MHLSTNLGSVGLVIIGTISSSITLNPIIIGVISGCGVLRQTHATTKKYYRKLENCKFAYKRALVYLIKNYFLINLLYLIILLMIIVFHICGTSFQMPYGKHRRLQHLNQT